MGGFALNWEGPAPSASFRWTNDINFSGAEGPAPSNSDDNPNYIAKPGGAPRLQAERR
jgi:hypothetical protein